MATTTTSGELFSIVIHPSDKIFDELGNNPYTFEELLAEFIDNSIAASEGKTVNVEIEVGVSVHPHSSYLRIKDDASGIDRSNLGEAISPAAAAGKSGLNEHGLGMKQAIPAIGQLQHLITKVASDEKASVVSEFKFGEIFVTLMEVEWKHGTEIKISHLRPIVPTGQQAYTMGVVPHLSARFRRFLNENAPRLRLTIRLVDADSGESGEAATLIAQWNVERLKPILFHPNTRKNEPVLKKSYAGAGWAADLSFGYAPRDDEYKEMGLKKPERYEPYHVSIKKQGLDIIRNDRIIKFHQLSELEIISAPHNQYNYVRGEVDLKKGFTTSTNKVDIKHNEAFKELLSLVTEDLEKGHLLVSRTYPDEIPEKLLRDRLKHHLLTRMENQKKVAITEFSVGGLTGFIDVLADGEAWEIKNEQAGGLEIYQLFAYMDMGGIDIGYLVAPSFSAGAQGAAEFITKKHNKTLKIVPLKDYPINHPPDAKERAEYYG